MDLTLDGFPAVGLVFDELPPRDDQGNNSKSIEGTAVEDSVSIHTDTEVDAGEVECSQCGTQAQKSITYNAHTNEAQRI